MREEIRAGETARAIPQKPKELSPEGKTLTSVNYSGEGQGTSPKRVVMIQNLPTASQRCYQWRDEEAHHESWGVHIRGCKEQGKKAILPIQNRC